MRSSLSRHTRGRSGQRRRPFRDQDADGSVPEEPERESRLMSLLASLPFSVPTAFLLWLSFNENQAGIRSMTFFGSLYLWITIGVFAVLAFAMPKTFPDILGAVWRWFFRVDDRNL